MTQPFKMWDYLVVNNPKSLYHGLNGYVIQIKEIKHMETVLYLLEGEHFCSWFAESELKGYNNGRWPHAR